MALKDSVPVEVCNEGVGEPSGRQEWRMSAPTTARRAASQGRIADFNQTVILDSIRRSDDGVSRVELAAATGLSAQAVTNIVRQLLATGLISEGRRAPIARGKPRTMLNLNPDGQY